jgi:beta-1,4-mannooligosaccharide/beta-1,4-mannosyl-N-acetylglucosamine phosphorylase
VRRNAAPGLFTRSAANPILIAGDVPYPANSVFNPGAARLDGETVLLVRVEDLRGMSQLHVARSVDGLTAWRFDPDVLLRSDVERYPEEIWGCEDPRLTWLPERDEWAIAYTAYSRRGPMVSLAMTRDFRTAERCGPVMPPEDKDAAMFPRRIDGRWAMIHRPSPLRGGAHMWISFSPDLRHWGDHSLLLEARDGAWWDAGKIGLGPPPLETPDGWLLMYHGVRQTGDGPIYRVGLALLDLENPRIVLHRTDEWVFGPAEPYETQGDVGRVVFPCGWIVDAAGDRLMLYYGAADTVVGAAEAAFSEVMARVTSPGAALGAHE